MGFATIFLVWVIYIAVLAIIIYGVDE